MTPSAKAVQELRTAQDLLAQAARSIPSKPPILDLIDGLELAHEHIRRATSLLAAERRLSECIAALGSETCAERRSRVLNGLLDAIPEPAKL